MKALPTKQQENWQNAELGMFVHFGLNTFNDKEWSDGTLPKESFNPEKLDVSQWVQLAKNAGFKYLMLTAKHHDGFCLWQTKSTDYSVNSIPFMDGKCDIVKQCAEQCKKLGIKFGIYLSPWDRHEKCYKNKEEYDKFYLSQLKELMTGYGDIFEVWFDGAGSEGRVYDWDKIVTLVHTYQPEAMIFNMGRPTIRWVGNEAGIAPYPCTSVAKQAKLSMFTDDMTTWDEKTNPWVPAECDTTLRNEKWFWHENDEKSIKTPEELEYIYLHSVGYGTNLLMNIAPDKNGLIPKADEDAAMKFSAFVKSVYADKVFETKIDGDVFETEFDDFIPLSYIIMQEDLSFGENILKYKIDARIKGGYITIVNGCTVGHKKIDVVKGLSVRKIKLTILEKSDDVHIKSFALYR